MAKRRRKKNWLQNLSGVSLLSLLFNPVTMMVCVSVLAILLWNRFHERLDLSADQTIDAETLHLNPPPEWIKTRISKVAIEESRLDEIRLSRPDAIERVVASLAIQPWVKSVSRVVKNTSGIHVLLEYRRPAAIIEIGEDKLVPVDDDSVVLDGRDFEPDDLMKYWRISLPRPLANGLTTGKRWDDMRVNDCVLIARLWPGEDDRAGLFRIVNRSHPTRDRLRLNPYELWTRRGTIVIWGNPPGHEAAGEAPAAKKIQAIRQFVRQNGPLDALTIRYLDVRTGEVTPGSSKLAEGSTDFVHQTF